MQGFKRFVTYRPIAAVVLFTFIWSILTMAGVWLWSQILTLPAASQTPQSIGTLAATILLLLLAYRWGWLREMGLSRLGSWQVWLVTLFVLAYALPIHLFAFFKRPDFDFGLLTRSAEASSILWRQLIVGFVEESLFRGLLIYILIRVWGGTRQGIFLSAAVPPIIFGMLHMWQVSLGLPPSAALILSLESIMSGFWWGAIRLRWGSIWPLVLIHTLTNVAVQIQTIVADSAGSVESRYLVLALLELPLLLFGIWLLRREPLRPVVPDVP